MRPSWQPFAGFCRIPLHGKSEIGIFGPDASRNKFNPNPKNMTRYRLLFCFICCCMLASAKTRDTGWTPTDQAIRAIYNTEFGRADSIIRSGLVADGSEKRVLTLELLWWKMICENTAQAETDFSNYLDRLGERERIKTEGLEAEVIFESYQVRYANYRGKMLKSISLYMQMQSDIKKLGGQQRQASTSLSRSIFALVAELNEYIGIRIEEKVNLFYSKTLDARARQKIEAMNALTNADHPSFELIKHYLLGKVYLEIEKNDTKALEHFTRIETICPANRVIRQLTAEIRSKKAAG